MQYLWALGGWNTRKGETDTMLTATMFLAAFGTLVALVARLTVECG